MFSRLHGRISFYTNFEVRCVVVLFGLVEKVILQMFSFLSGCSRTSDLCEVWMRSCRKLTRKWCNQLQENDYRTISHVELRSILFLVKTCEHSLRFITLQFYIADPCGTLYYILFSYFAICACGIFWLSVIGLVRFRFSELFSDLINLLPFLPRRGLLRRPGVSFSICDAMACRTWDRRRN